jgi:GMP synthase (glutamine-hydrolysing)
MTRMRANDALTTPMKPLIIIKAGSTFPSLKPVMGDFEDWVVRGCGLSADNFSVIHITENEALPAIDQISGIIITGSHAMVTDQEPWMQSLASWIPAVVNRSIPLLGICFGHQLLAQAMGGYVDYHPQGLEIGAVAITLTKEGRQDMLFDNMPDNFLVHSTHEQTVIKLPANAVILAENLFETHHAFRLGDRAWGVQFHPEFTADIMKIYAREEVESMSTENYDINALEASICNTGDADAVLKNFMAIVQKR